MQTSVMREKIWKKSGSRVRRGYRYPLVIATASMHSASSFRALPHHRKHCRRYIHIIIIHDLQSAVVL